jgi:hypothetical protein
MTARLAVLRMEICSDGPGDEAEREDADGEEEDTGDFEGVQAAGHGAAGEEQSGGERGGADEQKCDAGDGGLRREMRGNKAEAGIDGDGRSVSAAATPRLRLRRGSRTELGTTVLPRSACAR